MLLNARRLVMSMAADVTERRAAEEALAASEACFRTALKNSPVIFAQVDADLRYTWIFNPHTDFDPSSIVGKRDDELDSGPGIDALMELKRHVFESGGQQRREITFDRSDKPRTYDMTATPVRDAEGRVQTLVTAALDITERRTAEEALRTLNETLEARIEQRTKQVRWLGRALAMAEQEERERIAHVLHDDLQQVLFAVKYASARAGSERFDGERLNGLVDRAIAITRALSHELSPPLLDGDGDLEPLLAWLASRKRDLYGLKVEIRADGVAVPTRELQVLLYQLLRELLFNVVKHAGTDRACVTAERTNGRIRLVVEDEGRGFDTVAMRHDKGGMGLQSIRERVELVGGRCTVESAPRAGTRVTLELPCHLEEERAVG